jgi:glycogen synthase
LVAPTRAMLDSISADYGRRERMRVIPNGRDASAFAAEREKQPFVLSVGRLWDDAKNVRALADVARELEWPVRIAGNATAPDGQAVEFPEVTWLGCCTPGELARQYARASIYALPARYEPFGLSVLEAALSGCALVLGEIPSLREIWGDAAWYVASQDRAELRDAIRRLIRTPELRCELAARARRRAEEFSVRRMTDGYLETYRGLLAALTPARPTTETLA